MKSIDLNLLPALEALLDEQHVTRAGERLHLTQSAMSGILRRLRDHFDDELLVRSGNDLRLTPLAESLIPMVRDARRATDRLFAAGAAFNPFTSNRRFTIAASDYVQAVLAPGFAQKLERMGVDVRVDFVPHPNELMRDPPSALLKFDLVVLPPLFLPAFERTSEVLFDDEFVCVISSKHPVVAKGLPGLHELSGLPMVTASFGALQHTLPLGELQLARSDIELRRPTMEVSSYLALPSIVRKGEHWALIPRRLADSECPPPDFTVFEPPFDTEPFSDAMFWHSSRSHDPAVGWLRRLAHQVVEELEG